MAETLTAAARAKALKLTPWQRAKVIAAFRAAEQAARRAALEEAAEALMKRWFGEAAEVVRLLAQKEDGHGE